ncbi:unnamed protein product [Brachionus calyciflorus]|uniref:Uncharacterized protein n=1 Tax=Brachionus calyciflorus TaxID=104777 RepID=A0A814CNH6_9BILA|nr:unnamed protein product [Brachionus calyciflorus]
MLLVCEWCQKIQDDLKLLNLPCGYLICKDHFDSITDTFDCFICKTHPVSKSYCYNMPKNRVKLAELDFLTIADSIKTKIDEILPIKNDPNHAVNETISFLINKIDLKRELTKLQYNTQIDDYFDKLIQDVKKIKLSVQDYVDMNLSDLNLEIIQTTFSQTSSLTDKLKPGYFDSKIELLRNIDTNKIDQVVNIFKVIEKIDFENKEFKFDPNKIFSINLNQILDLVKRDEAIEQTPMAKIIPKDNLTKQFGLSYIEELSNGDLVGVSDLHCGTLIIWNPFNTKLKEIKVSEKKIKFIKVSDNDEIVTVTNDFYVKIYRDESLVKMFQISSNRLKAIDTYSNYFVSADTIMNITLRDFTNGKIINTFKAPNFIHSIKVYRNDELLIGDNESICLWNLRTSECLKEFKILKRALSIDLLSENEIVFGTRDGKICCWNVNENKRLSSQTISKNPLAICKVYEKNKIFSCSEDGELRLWEKCKGGLIVSVKRRSKEVCFGKILKNKSLLTCTKTGLVTILKKI